jgi:hypothetical protein
MLTMVMVILTNPNFQPHYVFGFISANAPTSSVALKFLFQTWVSAMHQELTIGLK